MKTLLCAGACAVVWAAGAADETPNEPIEPPPAVAAVRAAPAVAAEASAADVLYVCRAMLPVRPVRLKGALILRNRRGIVQSEHDYTLVMHRGPEASQLDIHLFPRGETNETAAVAITRRPGVKPTILFSRAGAPGQEPVSSPLARVLDTDVTWLDLTFDFLWWNDAAYEAEREGESVHGQKCRVIFVKPEVAIEGLKGVRLWVDKKTGCLMQAEQVGADGKPLRRLWGTRIKKFDGKWMVSVLEVETLGSHHRTKITVDDLAEL